MRRAPKSVSQPPSPEAIGAEIDRVAGLSLAKLRATWAAAFGRAPPKSLWRDLLIRTLAWRIQEKALGGHDKATLKFLEAYGRKKESEQLYQRLESGTILVREFGGIRHTVTILPDGFVWQQRTYSSLSAIAQIITGTNWNGPRFFGLREGQGPRGNRQQETAA